MSNKEKHKYYQQQQQQQYTNNTNISIQAGQGTTSPTMSQVTSKGGGEAR